MTVRSFVCGVAVLVPLMVLAPAAAAQTTITLEGIVQGPGGQPVSGAQIGVTDIATRERRNATTRPNGEFRILGLFSGKYSVEVRAIGFKPVVDSIQLIIGQRARMSFTLERSPQEIAGVAVTAERVKQVEVQRLSISAPVLKEEIENLPLNARGVMNLASIAPGIKSYSPQQGRALPSAGGAPDLRFINLYMDGVEMKSLFNGNLVGIPQTGSPLPQEALEEFRVFMNPYDAEYSRAGSYVISAVSRRGTDRWEGSAFGFFQNKDFIARTNFQSVAPDFSRNQFGVNVRGPLSKGKLYFAGSYEGAFIDNFIDVVPGRPAFNPDIWQQYGGSFKAPNTNNTGFARVTWTPREQHTVDVMGSTRYLSGESNFGGRVSQDGGITQKYIINTGQVRHRWLPSSNLVNEFSLQYVGWYHNEGPLVPGVTRQYPSIRFGTNTFPLVLKEKHYRVVNRSTYNINDLGGSHLIKFGVELAKVDASQYLPNNVDGLLNFPTDTSTLPNTASVGIGFTNPAGVSDAEASATGYTTGFYVNDEWRPIPNLAINLGVRYDAELNTINNDYVTPWSKDARLTAIPQLQDYIGRGDRENDLNNISPRISFSLDPFNTNRTFLRGGYAIIFDRVTSFIGFQERLNSEWRTYNFVNPGTTDINVLKQRVATGGVNAAVQPIMVKNRMNTPENRQWSLGVGHQFNDEFGINVDYVQQSIRNLYVRLNPNYFDVALNRRALTTAFGDIILWDDFGKGKFSALLTQGTWQRGATRVNLAYTLGFYESEFDGNLAPVFPFRSSYEMQKTSGDERHRFVVSTVTRIPLGFTLSGIATVASPRPFPVTDGRDLNRNNVTFDDFPDGDRTKEPDGGWKNWYRTVDLRLARSLFNREGKKFTLIAEVFNVFNSDNVLSYSGRQFDNNGGLLEAFGTPTGAFSARQGQVGFRLDF